MKNLKRCYQVWIHGLRYAQPVFLLAIRVLVGVGFMSAGWGKLTNVQNTAEYFAGLGIPLPTLNVYLAGAAETVGGALLLLGAASRISTIPLIFTMAVAYATDNKAIFGDLLPDPLGFAKEFVAAAPAPYLITAFVVLLFGPGLFSVDGLLKRFVIDPKSLHEAGRASAATPTDSAGIQNRPAGEVRTAGANPAAPTNTSGIQNRL